MGNTLGYHLVKSGYGLWLPGDERGSWSEAWDDEIGFHHPHTMHEGDPVRHRMAMERMKHPPVLLTDVMIDAVVGAIGDCIERSQGGLAVVAMTIERTHVHLLIPHNGRDINNTAKWIADRTTKAVHRRTDHKGPVWCKGKWCTFVFDQSQWDNTIEYIERHNERAGRPRRPYPFLMAYPV